MKTKRYVLDTNVLVSAVCFSGSLPDQVLRRVLNDGVLLFSEATITELQEVLLRPKFDRFIGEELRQQFVFELVTSALVVQAKQCSIICRDSKDQKFLELIGEGQPDFIISGDKDLLVFGEVEGCQVVTPASFLAQSSQP